MPSSAMSRRRTVVPGVGSLTSVRSRVAGSTLTRQGAPLQATHRKPSASSLMPYGPRVRRLHRDELDVAGRRVQPADHVAELQGEEQDALAVEHRRVRVLRVGVGHLEFGDLARLRVELADGAVLVARVPDVAGVIEHHRVRHGVRRQRIFLHLAGLRVDAADQVGPLPGPPDAAVRRLHRVARALAEGRRRPLLEGDVRCRPASASACACRSAGNGVARYSMSWSRSAGLAERSIMVPVSSFQPSRV